MGDSAVGAAETVDGGAVGRARWGEVWLWTFGDLGASSWVGLSESCEREFDLG
jgi:hypothetical protein